MNTLIVYYSLEGNTAYAAEKIAASIGADTLRLRPKKAYADKAMAKLTKAISKDSFEAQAVFIDPKKKHADSTDAAIAEFCRKLQEVQ